MGPLQLVALYGAGHLTLGEWHDRMDLERTIRTAHQHRRDHPVPRTGPCDHTDYEADAALYRVSDPDTGEPFAFNMRLRVKCKGCGLPFGFRGVPTSPNELLIPHVTDDGLELTLPLFTPAETVLRRRIAG